MTDPKPIERPVLRRDLVLRGEERGSKLTEAQVLEIIETIRQYPDAAISDLAQKRGVSTGCISKIKNDRAWMHLPRPWVIGSFRRGANSKADLP